MPDERVPADYMDMAISEAQRFDKMVRENFMPAIVSTAKQVIDDYGVLDGVCVDVGCGTAIFAIELCRRSNLKIYGLENAKAIYEVAHKNIEKEGLTDRIIPVLGDAHDLPFENEFAELIISRGAYHCWKDKGLVLREIHRVLKKGGIGFVGGGFGRYISQEELDRMTVLRDRSLKEDAKAYRSPKELEEIIHKTGISNFRIIYDTSGLWAELKK
jgi:ubiquinone/menaquinone biosynthesis C-methylase UbiE